MSEFAGTHFAEEKACIFHAILPATEVVCVAVELKVFIFS